MKLKLPTNAPVPNVSISQITTNLKQILKEMLKVQSDNIDKNNIDNIKEILAKADLLITECHVAKNFYVQKNRTLGRVQYEYQKLNLKYETYISKHYMIDVSSALNKIEEKQKEFEEQSNNLVYTILGFIASFSIVSAAVAAIDKIQGTLNIMLFMAFTIFILITTLIGLDNFYRTKYTPMNKLQSNYFLWIVITAIIIILLIFKGLMYITDNNELVNLNSNVNIYTTKIP